MKCLCALLIVPVILISSTNAHPTSFFGSLADRINPSDFRSSLGRWFGGIRNPFTRNDGLSFFNRRGFPFSSIFGSGESDREKTPTDDDLIPDDLASSMRSFYERMAELFRRRNPFTSFPGFGSSEEITDKSEETTDKSEETIDGGGEIDVRGWLNKLIESARSGGGDVTETRLTVIHGSRTVSNRCGNNHNCTLCINDDCYRGKYGVIRVEDDCPIAVCAPDDCSGFYISEEDKCPICDCSGFATKEPCRTDDDCASGACQDGLCYYPKIDLNLLKKTCDSDFDCPTSTVCMFGLCESDDRRVPTTTEFDIDLLTIPCEIDSDCPDSSLECVSGACEQQEEKEITDIGGRLVRRCISDGDCLQGFKCITGECVKKSPEQKDNLLQCISSRECAFPKKCVNNACVI